MYGIKPATLRELHSCSAAEAGTDTHKVITQSVRRLNLSFQGLIGKGAKRQADSQQHQQQQIRQHQL